MPPANERPDTELVEQTRRGDREAFAELWRRHARAGLTVARSITSSFDPDDLLAEAYAKIFQAIANGHGPTSSFRAYLFTTIRSVAASWGRARRETPLEDAEAIEDPAFSDSATMEALDRSLTARAFRSLPSRWQEVLWYCEVEGMAPHQVAPLLGMNAAAVSALAYRAREGLRQAWVQAHLAAAPAGSDCRWTTERLGAYARHGLGRRDTAKVESHLASCARCTIVAAEAKEVGSRLALVLLPLTVGVGATAAYAAWAQTGANGVSYALGSPAAALPAAAAPAGAVSAGGASAGAASAGHTTSLAWFRRGSRGHAAATATAVGGGVLVAAAIAGAFVLGPQLFPAPAPAVVAAGDSTTEAPSAPDAAEKPAVTPEQARPTLPPAPVPVPPVVAPTDPAPSAPAVPAPSTPAAPTKPSEPKPPAAPVPAAPEIASPADATATAAKSLDASGTGDPGAEVRATASPAGTPLVPAAAIGTAASSSALPLGTTRAAASGAWTLPLDLSALGDGAWTVSFAQTTASGTSPAATRGLTIDRTALPPEIAAVDTGSGASAGLLAPIASGTAEPGATVEVFDAGILQQTVTAGADGTWRTDELTGVAPSYSLTARQTDPLGNVSAPSGTVTGSVAVPEVSASGGPGTVGIAVHGLPGASVRLYGDGGPRDHVLTLDANGDAGGTYLWTTGDHRIGAVYVDGDRRGLLGDVPVTVG